jgi:hypothetical protein
MGDEWGIRKAMLEKHLKKQNVGADVDHDEKDDQDDEQNQMMNANCKNTNIYRYQ